ncbi:MAG TPA: retron St85 family effector protein [Thermoanaerobaculia bacterium]
MPWLEHPRYVPARERLIEYLRSDRYRFRRLAPVIFLCGGANSERRATLRDYLRGHFPHLGLFYAERVWEHIASRTDRGALKMEADLALLADLVVIIVESPGTFTELGAFSLSDPLRAKLLAIVDRAYEDDESFVTTGPLRWITMESRFAPPIYVSLDRILEAADEVEDRLLRIPTSRATKISDLAESPKHLLFFLCDLIAVIYPVTLEMIEYYLARIAPSILSSDIDVPTLVGLAVAMEVLAVHSVTLEAGEVQVFSPSAPNVLEHPFHHRKLLDLPSQRAAHVSVLLALPEARAVLASLRSGS